MKKSFEQNEMVTTGAALASHAPSDGGIRNRAVPVSPDGYAMGKPFFNCDMETFMKCRESRKKRQRWFAKLGNSEWAAKVREYSRRNGNPDILVRNTDTGAFMFLQNGLKKGRA